MPYPFTICGRGTKSLMLAKEREKEKIRALFSSTISQYISTFSAKLTCVCQLQRRKHGSELAGCALVGGSREIVERTTHVVPQIQFPENTLFKCTQQKILPYTFLLFTIQRFSMKPRAKMRCPWSLLLPFPLWLCPRWRKTKEEEEKGRGRGFFFAKEKGGKESSLAFLLPLGGGGERRREGKRPCKKKRKGGARGGASPPTESQLARSVGRQGLSGTPPSSFSSLSLPLLFTQLG